MSSIIRRRRGLMGVSVMRVLPELGLNTQSLDSSPLSVTALLIAPGARLRVALYRESGLVLRPEAAIRALVGNLSPRSNSGRSLHDGEGALHAPKVSLRRRGISLLDLFDWPHQLNETSARSQRQLVKSDNCRVPPPVL